MNGQITSKRYLDDNGEWEERKSFFLDGKEVTEAEFLDAFPDKSLAGGGPSTPYPGNWPMKGVLNLAVHEKQVEQARARVKRHGISVEYNADGSLTIPDTGNYRKLCKLEGKVLGLPGLRNTKDYN